MAATNVNTINTAANDQMKNTIGNVSYVASLQNNATAAAFDALLPMTLEMTELNGNEKYARLAVKLTTNASNSGSIQKGDLMVYGSNTLVPFYSSFTTSYSYTRLVKINDTTRLAVAVGAGAVTVTFELK